MRYAYLTLLTLVCVLGLATSSGSVFAQAEKEVCGSVQIISGESCDPARGESRVKYLMETGINIFAIVMGIIAVFMIIIAGLTIATSGGGFFEDRQSQRFHNICFGRLGGDCIR